MIKTLIAFGSKTGTTKKCAQLLQVKLGFGDLLDLSKPVPNISGYGLVVIGGSIRMGKLNKDTDKFVKKNLELLKKKKTAFFICCGLENQSKKMLANVYPRELMDHAVAARSFGGELPEKSFFARMISKSSPERELPHIDETAIDGFAKNIIRKLENV